MASVQCSATVHYTALEGVDSERQGLDSRSSLGRQDEERDHAFLDATLHHATPVIAPIPIPGQSRHPRPSCLVVSHQGTPQ